MRKNFLDEEHSITEWAIRWTAPEDIADTVTLVTVREQAVRYLALTVVLPGGQSGEVVYRTVTHSPWRTDVPTEVKKEGDAVV